MTCRVCHAWGRQGRQRSSGRLSRAKRKEAKQRGLFCGAQDVRGKKKQRGREVTDEVSSEQGSVKKEL